MNIVKKRVMIVDDHPVVRQGLALLIDQQPDLEVCAEADSVADAFARFTETSPDLVIIDLSLKDGSGIELIKEIKARNEHARMLVSSMHDESLFAERVLRAGAKGYISKQEATGNIVEAARHVLEGRVYLSPRMSDQMLHRLVASGDDPDRSPIDSLSDRELEVFEMIGQGLTTRQIAGKLDLSPKTVETYRENIKAKLNLPNGTALTRHAVQWLLENT
ncbi:MAG: response regulator transcription factor [Planctomycetota bacterium]|nr:response regulator transcription factor [Planctomycetaceae bacterium]MDQ3331743.1 response regulator transcription factor [Planctomycetota bacterium]